MCLGCATLPRHRELATWSLCWTSQCLGSATLPRHGELATWRLYWTSVFGLCDTSTTSGVSYMEVVLDQSVFGQCYTSTTPGVSYMELVLDQSVFGLYGNSTTPGVSYMELVPDRCAQTLISIIERVVRHGSIIHSDQWAAYRQLNTNYTYATVNHSKNFVDPVTGVRPQAIELYSAKAKHKFKAMKGVATHQLPGYLDERMWRDPHGPDATAAFHIPHNTKTNSSFQSPHKRL